MPVDALTKTLTTVRNQNTSSDVGTDTMNTIFNMKCLIWLTTKQEITSALKISFAQACSKKLDCPRQQLIETFDKSVVTKMSRGCSRARSSRCSCKKPQLPPLATVCWKCCSQNVPLQRQHCNGLRQSTFGRKTIFIPEHHPCWSLTEGPSASK